MVIAGTIATLGHGGRSLGGKTSSSGGNGGLLINTFDHERSIPCASAHHPNPHPARLPESRVPGRRSAHRSGFRSRPAGRAQDDGGEAAEDLLALRYDLSPQTSATVLMTRGKPVQTGIRVKTDPGLDGKKGPDVPPSRGAAGQHGRSATAHGFPARAQARSSVHALIERAALRTRRHTGPWSESPSPRAKMRVHDEGHSCGVMAKSVVQGSGINPAFNERQIRGG